MNIQLVSFAVEAESESFTAVTGKARVHVLGLGFGKSEFFAPFFGVALIAAFHVAVFAVQVSIGNAGDLHEAPGFFVPVPHTFTCEMKAFREKGPETR
jgi:hypothetical protein